MQVSELRSSTLYCSSRGERGRAVQIFPSERLKDGGVFVWHYIFPGARWHSVLMEKPIGPWSHGHVLAPYAWFLEETNQGSLSRGAEHVKLQKGIMEEEAQGQAMSSETGKGEEGCSFVCNSPGSLLLGLALRKIPIQFGSGSG